MTEMNAFIKITNSEVISLKNNKADGSRPFLDADQVKDITLDGNELIKNLTNDDIDEIKSIILQDIEEKLNLAKGKDGNKVFDGILQFLSTTSAGLLVGYLQSQGLNK